MSSKLLLAAANPPDPEALARVAQLTLSGYANTLSQVLGSPAAATLKNISAPPQPMAWTWIGDDSVIVLVNGTTDPHGEYGPQFVGWQAPLETDGGAVNAWYSYAAQLYAAALPGRVDMVIGHSMGGAIAVELCKLLRDRGGDSANCVCVALGAPRSRDSIAAAAISGTNTVQVGYVTDSVTVLPGDLPTGYSWRHPGRIYQMDDYGALTAVDEQPVGAGSAGLLLVRWGTAPHAPQWYFDTLLRQITPGPDKRWPFHLDP